jgi:hypothetical protein
MKSLQPSVLGFAPDAITNNQTITGTDTNTNAKTGNNILYDPETVEKSWANQPSYRKSIYFVQTSVDGFKQKSYGRPPAPSGREIFHDDIIQDYLKEISKLTCDQSVQDGTVLKGKFAEAAGTINLDERRLVYLKSFIEEDDQKVFAEVGVTDNWDHTVLSAWMAVKHPLKSLRTSPADD